MARSRWARSASAPYGVPPRMIGVGSPRRRLNSRPVRVGSASARRSAASPVRTSPSARRTTIDGMVADPLAELEDLEATVARRRGGRVGRSEIDPERVLHQLTSTSRCRGCTADGPSQGAESSVRTSRRSTEGTLRARRRTAPPMPRGRTDRARHRRAAGRADRHRPGSVAGPRFGARRGARRRRPPSATEHGRDDLAARLDAGRRSGSPGPRPWCASSASSRRARAR